MKIKSREDIPGYVKRFGRLEDLIWCSYALSYNPARTEDLDPIAGARNIHAAVDRLGFQRSGDYIRGDKFMFRPGVTVSVKANIYPVDPSCGGGFDLHKMVVTFTSEANHDKQNNGSRPSKDGITVWIDKPGSDQYGADLGFPRNLAGIARVTEIPVDVLKAYFLFVDRWHLGPTLEEPDYWSGRERIRRQAERFVHAIDRTSELAHVIGIARTFFGASFMAEEVVKVIEARLLKDMQAAVTAV